LQIQTQKTESQDSSQYNNENTNYHTTGKIFQSRVNSKNAEKNTVFHDKQKTNNNHGRFVVLGDSYNEIETCEESGDVAQEEA